MPQTPRPHVAGFFDLKDAQRYQRLAKPNAANGADIPWCRLSCQPSPLRPVTPERETPIRQDHNVEEMVGHNSKIRAARQPIDSSSKSELFPPYVQSSVIGRMESQWTLATAAPPSLPETVYRFTVISTKHTNRQIDRKMCLTETVPFPSGVYGRES